MQKENLFTPNCIRTYTGKYFDVFNPDPDKICIEDIAHALANIPRFGGHLPRFFSVAEHSLDCMEAALLTSKLETLMHDSPEYALFDMPSPTKKRLPEYQKVENNLAIVIGQKYKIRLYPLPGQVKEIDAHRLQWEWDHLMLGKMSFRQKLKFHFKYWTIGTMFYSRNKRMEKRFIKEFHRLTNNEFK